MKGQLQEESLPTLSSTELLNPEDKGSQSRSFMVSVFLAGAGPPELEIWLLSMAT